MAVFNKFNCFVEGLAEKKHNLGSDTLTVALCASSNAPVATNSVLTDLTQISYTGLSTRAITTTSSTQTSGVYKLVLQDLILTASAQVAAFRYIVIYNDTAANDELIGWYDYGTNKTLGATDTFTIDFDGTNGFLTLT